MRIDPIDMVIESKEGKASRSIAIGSVAGARFSSRDVEGMRKTLDEGCDHGAAPLRLTGSYRGQPLHVADACAEGLPEGAAGLFQSNLLRECPQRCIH